MRNGSARRTAPLKALPQTHSEGSFDCPWHDNAATTIKICYINNDLLNADIDVFNP
jgi:hypothetical protein